ncbi:hypothetical protein GE061_008974 [Apolygus lucorum]|uniref:Regulatory protein zeste n=1 Tax=Apolygus lucorum TaxID=248454 RepID=A0A6A4KBI6_APOLU|nr:hypothetical protein GE061_008974 [Apolygus lucorum]
MDKKRIAFSESEKVRLRELVMERRDVVENRKSDVNSQMEKKRAWDVITADFNSSGQFPNIPTGPNARTIAALEAVAPNLPNDCFCNVAQARELFLHSVISFLRHHDYSNQLVDLGEATMAQVLPMMGLTNAMQGRFTAGIAAHGQPLNATIAAYVTDANGMADIAQAFCTVLSYLHTNFKTARACSLSANVFSLTYIALAKRGTISENKLNKIRAEIQTETRKTLTFTAQEVEIMHREMSPIVTGANARAIMDGLAGDMDGYSLRLRLTVQQAAKGGMTSYWSIHSALTNFPTFNWAEAHRYLARDFQNFEVACNLVRGNEYYGFNADLGDAAAPRYKSLGWLAMHLLVRFNAAEYGSLAQYATYNRRPDHAEQLQTLIDNFHPELQELDAQATEQLINTFCTLNMPAPPAQANNA